MTDVVRAIGLSYRKQSALLDVISSRADCFCKQRFSDVLERAFQGDYNFTSKISSQHVVKRRERRSCRSRQVSVVPCVPTEIAP